MSLAHLGRRIGNVLYQTAFPVYRPLYEVFKRYGDRVERRLLAQYLSAGCVVVDAGANIGIYAQFLAKCVGAAGTVHSFEPDPKNFIRLRAALSVCSNARLNQLALSDKTGESLLYVSDHLNVDHRAYPTKGEPRRTVSIRTIRLDDYFKPNERVDLIKMDIQGFEWHALQGAQRVLEENQHIMILMEFWPYGLNAAGSSGEALLEWLEARGFIISTVEKSKPNQLARSVIRDNADWYINLFAKR